MRPWSLPPGASTQRVLEEIEELTNPKLRPGKKSLSTEQQNLKALVLSVLDRVTDESGKDARTAHVTLLHDAAHPSALEIPIGK